MSPRRSSQVPHPKWLDDDDEIETAGTAPRQEEPPRRKSKHKRRNPIVAFFKGLTNFTLLLIALALLGTVVFVVTAGASYYIVRRQITGSDETAPNLLGMSMADALRSLNKSASSLSIKLDGEEPSEMVKEGEITSQVPPANSRVKAGSSIRVKVSKGNTVVQCPNLLDMNYQDAIIKLHETGLRDDSATRTVPNARVKKDCVVQQDPPAGSELQRQTVVKLLISSGPPKATIRMPDLVNSTQIEAGQILQTLGLQPPKVTEVARPGTDNGVIVDQKPAANSTVSPEDPISVTVVSNLGVETPEPTPEPQPTIETSVPSLPSDGPAPQPVTPATPPDPSALPQTSQ